MREPAKAYISSEGIERGLLLLGTLVFIYIYCWLYRTEIVPVFEYMGLTYGFRWTRLAWFCFASALVPLTWLPLDVRRPSQMIQWFLFLMVYLPVCVTPILSGQFDTYIIVKTLLAVFGAFLLLNLILAIPRADIPRLKLSESRYRLLLITIFLTLLGSSILLFGIRLSFPTLSEVYGLREEFSARFSHYGRLPGYIVQWFGKTVTVLLFVYGMTRRRKDLLWLAVLGQVYIFSLLAEKALFFSLFFVFLVVLMLRGNPNRFGLKTIYGTIGLMLLGKLQSLLLGSGIILSMAMRRTLITPGINTAYFFEYYSYFSDHVYYAYNILGRLLPIGRPYGYDYSPARMVGQTYITYAKDYVINLNSNLWAEGFGDWGLPGVFVATVLLGFVLWVFDSVSRPLALVTTAGALASAVIGLANGSLYSQLMTNGLLLLLFLIYLMPPSQSSESESAERASV